MPGGGIRLGKILGIEIRLHFSWVIIFFLVGYSLSFFYYPTTYPRLSRSTHLGMGLVTTFFFFASILVHELSHSIVARRNGLPIRFITLFIFGGVSSISKEPDDANTEIKMAFAGPATSLLLGAGFGALWILGMQVGIGDAVTGVVGYLALINVALGVFNLMPGFPLDGGRLLRAGAWKITGNIERATKIAAGFGRGLAFLLIAGGLVLALGTPYLPNGLWLIFIGWFLDQAARSSYQQVIITQALQHVLVRDIMTKDPLTIPADISVREAVDRYFLAHKYGGFPVVRDGEPIGVVSLADLREVPPAEWDTKTVAEAMAPLGPDTVVSAETHVADLLSCLHSRKCDRLLVLEDHRVEGIVTNDDVAQYLRVQTALR
ncbi:MAG: CBS domain-containing protein [Actinobacteria bacterium]|nr:MAG: CBS domain-containing protein [Actinomycetota bacterium]